MLHGHDPRAVREYAWRDLELLMAVAPVYRPPQFSI